MQEHLLTGLLGLVGKEALVDSRWIVTGHVGRVDREGKALVGVLQLPEAVELPHVGHLDAPPLLLQAGGELVSHAQRTVEEVETPLTIETEHALAATSCARYRLLPRREGLEVGSRRQTMPVRHTRILPITLARHTLSFLIEYNRLHEHSTFLFPVLAAPFHLCPENQS